MEGNDGKTDRQCSKNCSFEARHSAVGRKGICILYSKPGSTSRPVNKHIMFDYVQSDSPSGYQSDNVKGIQCASSKQRSCVCQTCTKAGGGGGCVLFVFLGWP